MENLSLYTVEQSVPCTLPLHKKKYSKVNQALRTHFLQLIVQDNLSIKQASLALNINYSSAKAILASHRKTIISAHRNTNKHCKRAAFRTLQPIQAFMNPIQEFVCTTGGREVNRYPATLQQKPVFRAPIILLTTSKDMQYLENTSNSHQDQL